MPKGNKDKKKGKKMANHKLPYDPLDDEGREQVEPAPEPPEEKEDESWARPGDEDKPPEDLPKTTDVKEE
jgi:hypothetical protein